MLILWIFFVKIHDYYFAAKVSETQTLSNILHRLFTKKKQKCMCFVILYNKTKEKTDFHIRFF